MFSSITIGDGGEYSTIALWQVARRNNIPADKQVDDELTLLSGVHSVGALLSFWPVDEEITIKCVIQAHPSALHNGDWDSGVCLSGQGTQNWKVRNNDLNITYKDLVLKKTQIQFDQGDNYFGSIRGTGWDMSALHPGSLTFERCLIYTEGTPHTRMHYMSYVPSSSPSAFGTLEVNYNNCVLEDIYGPVYPNYGQIVPAYTQTSGDHTYNFRGCTLSRQSFTSTQRLTGNVGSENADGSLTINVSGCIEDTSAAAQPTLVAGHAINLGYYPGGAGFPSNLSATLTDHITNQASGSVYDWATTKTNVSYAVPLTFDGTVSSNQVGFVDNQGASSFRDYRLVADLDNLAVKYMTSGELPYKDITGYKRPAGTDQRDAGAFQSISDQVTVRNIGTSSADFTPDYATANLWDSTYYDNANVLNGETHVLRLKSGEGHSLGNLQVTMDGQANVNQSFILSGHEPHNGVWEEGAILDDQSGFSPDTGANNFSIKFKDIVVSGTTSGTGYTRPLTQRLGSTTHEQGNAATEHTFEFENCLIRYISTRSFGSNSSPQLNYGNNKGYITDDGNIIERGVTHHIFKNCVVIHPYPTSAYYGGFVLLGGEFASTNTSATFLAEGCTFINTQVRPNRYSDRFQFSAIGCIIYNEPSAHSRYTTEGGHSFFIDGGTSRDPDDFIIKDCIFNRGAGNALIPQNTSDDRLTFWIAEPLASEYVNDPSVNLNSASVSANASNYYWPRVNATNMSIRVPFNFDGSVSAGTTSFMSSATQDYRLVADQDNLAVQYMNVSNASNYDLAGRRRPGLTDAGAFQSYSDAILSSIIGSGVDGVSADHATVALFYAASGDSIINGQTFDLVFQNQEHDFIVNIGTNPLLEVDQKWIVRGDVSHGGKWDNGARFIETGLLTNQQWWGTVFNLLGKQDVIFEMKDIVLSSNFYHGNYGWFNAARAIQDAAHDCTYTFDRCLISIARNLGWPYPNLVAYNSGTGEQGLNTINILNTVVSGNTTPGTSNSLIQPYFFFGGGGATAGKGNTAHNFVGSTFYNRKAEYLTQQNNDYNISGCIIVSRGDDAERFLGGYAAGFRNTTTVDSLFSNSQSYEEFSLGTNHTNCTFDVDFYFDNEAHDGAVTFIGSALDPTGPLDFRLGGNPKFRTNLAEDYIPPQDDFGEPGEPGAFAYDYYLLKGIQLSKIPQSTIAYKVNIRKQ